MPAGVVTRLEEDEAIADFLASAAALPSALVVEGEAGIGKTTLWLAAIDDARQRGFRVLSARVGQAESVLAYAALADLLGDINTAVLGALPDLQRLALDRVLLRAGGEGPATDQRVVASAFVSVVERLAGDGPVLVAIDDVQWLDPSSKAAVVFATRRLKGPIGLLVTERCEPDKGTATSWLQLGRPDAAERIRVSPLTLGGLHTLMSERLGRSFPRPVMVRIGEISGGNPFYALELGRAMSGGPLSAEHGLPGTLADLVRVRIGRLEGDVRDVLLAVACVAAPTIELLARATETTTERIVSLLEDAETDEIIGIEGNRVRFSHPLLARGVYNDANPARRRAMHRALAAIEAQPELKARHLALSAATADEATLQALDAAADTAQVRGAPAAAAELLDMARKLGGDTPMRRMRSAQYHFWAGNADPADALVNESTIEGLPAGPLRAMALVIRATIRVFDNGYDEATELFARACDDAESSPAMLVPTLLFMSFCQLYSGKAVEAMDSAERAVAHAEQCGIPALISQALAMSALVNMMCERGHDERDLRRALELEDTDTYVPIPLSSSFNAAQVFLYTGRLDEASALMREVRRRYLERGLDTEMAVAAYHSALVEGWRGRLSEAELLAEEAVERAEQIGGDNILATTLTARAAAETMRGRERNARAAIGAAIAAGLRCGSLWAAGMPLPVLGLLEVSLGNYEAALATLQPLVQALDATPRVDFPNSWYLADAVEAMVALGRLEDAVPLIEALERKGRRLDRAWMLAIGARCRSMWLAGHGDVEAATKMARQAMTEHDRLPVPFERARTQLLLGQLQRRQRHKEAATATLTEALQAFEDIGTPLWADRARAELARTNVSPGQQLSLTPTERRVAELAAAGVTNRDIAATLFISPKTVEHNLGRVYRKLGIRGRAELGRRMDQLDVRGKPRFQPRR